jgi:hypothetical protein
MHPNEALLHKLFEALGRHDYETMATCYRPKAAFHDIAFDLQGARKIREMWRMICRKETDITVKTDIVEADDRTGRATLVETYRFGARKRKAGALVTNEIVSRFEFEEGRIKSQIDDCDPKKWATQAMKGPILGFLPGRIRLMRSLVANWKLWKFVRHNPE